MNVRAHAPDYIVLAITISLLLLGLVTLFSASSVRSVMETGSSTFYLAHQLLYGILPGIVAALAGYRISWKTWRKLALFILVGALILVILVLIPKFGVSRKGAARWIQLGPLVIQPAEFLKLGLIIYLASFFASRQGGINGFSKVTLPFLIILALIGGLLIAQPATGTFGVIALTAIGIYLLAGARLRDLALLCLVALLAFGILIAAAPYRVQRFMTFLNPGHDPQGAGYQVTQAMIGIGSGGVFGMGLGHSRQKFLFLPETIGDSIFAIFAEETGFFGASILLIFFFFLAHRGLKIAKNSHDSFARLFAGGIVIWISLQAFVNIAAISGLMPLTGVPLPFFSYGGSAMITLLAATGILLNISRYTTT